jgi:spore germination protein GerM
LVLKWQGVEQRSRLTIILELGLVVATTFMVPMMVLVLWVSIVRTMASVHLAAM